MKSNSGKKALIFCLSVILLFCLASCGNSNETAGNVASATENKKLELQSEENFDYYVDTDQTIMIAGYHGKEISVTVPEKIDNKKVASLGSGAFYNRETRSSEVISVFIPNNITIISSGAFDYCSDLSRIDVTPDHPKYSSIDGVLFEKESKTIIKYPCAKKGATYEIPQGVLCIGEKAFANCKCTKILIPNTVTEIQKSAFDYASIRSLDIPEGVMRIEENCFNYCSDLTSISLPNSLTYLGAGALFHTGIRAITIPNGITVLNSHVFALDFDLAKIELPDTLTEIGEESFDACTELGSLTIPGSVVTIEANPFRDCNSLKLTVSPENQVFEVKDNVLFKKDEKKLISYLESNRATSYSVPQGTTIIGGYAFWSCEDLTAIKLPDSLRIIEDNAFWFCKNLASIELPGGLTEIGNNAFAYCEKLKSVIIPDSVETIGDKAFADVKAPDLVITVGRDSYAEKYCKEKELKYNYPDSTAWLNN